MTRAVTRPDLSGQRGGVLAWAVLDFIKTLPGPDAAIGPISHAPQSWRSPQGMCFAGWTAELAGGTWCTETGNWLNDYLVARPDDPPLSTHLARLLPVMGKRLTSIVRWQLTIMDVDETQGARPVPDAQQPIRIIHASKRAAHALELNTDDPLHHPLFACFTTTESLEYQLEGLYGPRTGGT
ncbi:hypothetical protein [Herbidospora sp. RD11066]